MVGFHGQKFDFTGEDGFWYALISSLPSTHVNMRGTNEWHDVYVCHSSSEIDLSVTRPPITRRLRH